MSTSVFKPIQPFRVECARLGHQPRLPAAAASLRRARRVLFGPVDHNETQLFLERELAAHAVTGSSKWEFDFRNEVPLSPQGKSGRYVWRAVRQDGERITYAPKRQRMMQFDEEDEENNEGLYARPEDLVDPLRRAAGAAVAGDECDDGVDGGAMVCKKQSKITDFMQARKRGADPAYKKLSSSPKLPKMSRETSCS